MRKRRNVKKGHTQVVLFNTKKGPIFLTVSKRRTPKEEILLGFFEKKKLIKGSYWQLVVLFDPLAPHEAMVSILVPTRLCDRLK